MEGLNVIDSRLIQNENILLALLEDNFSKHPVIITEESAIYMGNACNLTSEEVIEGMKSLYVSGKVSLVDKDTYMLNKR